MYRKEPDIGGNDMNREDLEQAAYLRGWNDRPKGDMWFGVLVGIVIGMVLAWLIVVVG